MGLRGDAERLRAHHVAAGPSERAALTATLTEHHRFIAAAPSLLDVGLFDTEQLLGPRRVTDAWLLGVAVANNLRLVTFDGGVVTRIARHATPAHLLAL